MQLSLPEHEARLPWLAPTLEAYAGIDKNGERHKLIKQRYQHRVAKLATRMDQQAQQQQ